MALIAGKSQSSGRCSALRWTIAWPSSEPVKTGFCGRLWFAEMALSWY